MPSLLDMLGYAGNLLDLPGSSLRDILSGRNPFDQWTTPFSDVNRASGRDVLRPFLGDNEETGMSGWISNPMEGVKDIAGFGLEMVADPLNFVSLSPLWRALKGRKAVKGANAAQEAANAGRYGYVNPKLLDDYVPPPAVPAVVTSPLDKAKQIQALQDDADSLVVASGAHDDEWGTAWLADEISLGQSDRIADSTLQSLERAGLRGEYDSILKRIEELQAPEPERYIKYTPNAPENPMSTETKLLGYTPAPENPMFPGREVAHHGGHNWAGSATPQHPYGMMDLDRIHTGEGNTVKGPGGYFADDIRTTDRYYGMVANQAPSPDPVLVNLLRSKLDEVFTPGTVFDQNAAGMRRDVLDGLFTESSAGAPLSHVKVVGKGDGGYLLENVFGDGEVIPDVYQPEFRLHDWADELIGNPIPLVEPKPTRYTIDMPAGTKSRMMNWEGSFYDQPQAVQDLVQSHPTSKVLDDLDVLEQQAFTITEQMDRVKKKYGIKSFTPTPEDPAELLELRGKLVEANSLVDAKKAEAVKMFGSEFRFEQASQGISNGEKMADLLMGKHPGFAKFEDVTGLQQAGVPGMKNLATSTGKSAYNYAIWDKDLISQMRVRAIDEQRVPINPMFGPVKAEQRVIPQIADSPLTEVINPMSTQPLPGLAKPAMQGAAYQALARFNSYGGSL